MNCKAEFQIQKLRATVGLQMGLYWSTSCSVFIFEVEVLVRIDSLTDWGFIETRLGLGSGNSHGWVPIVSVKHGFTTGHSSCPLVFPTFFLLPDPMDVEVPASGARSSHRKD